MKTVLITGASSGIGRETAYVYAKNNYNIILAARRRENLEAVKDDIEKKYKNSVYLFDMDLSKTNSADLLYKQIKDEGLEVEVLINNAGFGIKGEYANTSMEKEERMIILNILTLTKLTKYFVKDMLNKGSGNIINIASTAGFQGIPGFSVYAATKAYVLHFTESIAEELKAENIRVTAICPGPTKSEFAKSANAENSNAFKTTPTSNDLAEFIYESMKKSKTTAIHGFKNKLMVFSQRTAPRDISTRIAGKFMK